MKRVWIVCAVVLAMIIGAIGYSAAAKKTFIDPRRCYGCGVCRAVCEKDAIHLQDRVQVPVAANMW